MQQLEFFNIPSPCIGVCCVNDKGYCQGCMRKRQERFEWLNFTDAEKLRVLRLCRQRFQRQKIKQQESEHKSLPSQSESVSIETSSQKSLFDEPKLKS